ncbi:MAG: hypothetical protein M1829_006711 [Trizodia sp. TS-e1964]|nr:MAG: hypothetical protein M1829_006711 [Trizodia sp. TS-e1964]
MAARSIATRILRPSFRPTQQHLRFLSPSILHHRTHTTTTEPTPPEPTPNPRVNPPASTLPPPLDLPTRLPTDSLLPFLFKRGKSCALTPAQPPPTTKTNLSKNADLIFYKSGLKAVYTNTLAARRVRASLTHDIPTCLNSGHLTRANYQLLRRASHDLRRVPPFALVFLLCGEFTPLVVLAMSGIVPRVCRVPVQIRRDREKAEVRRRESRASVKHGVRGKTEHVVRSLGLLPGWMLRWLPNEVMWWFVRRWMHYVAVDDRLLRRDGGVDGLVAEEVRLALVERGRDVLGIAEEVLRGDLERWLRRGEEGEGIERVLKP